MEISSAEKGRIRAAQMARNRRDSVFSCTNRAMKSDIILTLNKTEYIAGDVITGSVKIILTQEVKIKDLLLKITGMGRVSWDEKRTYSKGSATSVSLKNTETYLDHAIILLKKDKIPSSFANSKRRGSNIRASPASSISDMTSPSLSSCWGGAESEDGVLIPPGEHNFHFEFTLPKNLPSTYSGRWGAVRYSVKSVLERPWKFDIEREYEFTLTANMDLNEEPDLLRPLGALGEFRTGVLCCNGGLITLEVRLSRRGYVGGEDIPFQIVIDNNTGRKLNNAKVSLIQNVIFRAGHQTKRICHTLTTLSKGEISPRKVDRWESDKLTIPLDTPPTTNKNITTIQIRYTFTLSINHSTWQDEFIFPVNVIIGNQPFRKAVVQSYLNILGYSGTPKASPSNSPRLGNHKGTRTAPRPSPLQSTSRLADTAAFPVT